MTVPPNDSTPPSLAAIVLAGGNSSRMGQDKALIPIQGIPLLQRICEVALDCTPEVYVITPWAERYRAIAPPNCQWVHEQRLDQSEPPGPLIGFAQGLAQMQTEWVLLLACDLPNLRREILQSWVQTLSHTQQATALLPRGKKGWEPLCGFYRTSCLPSINRSIQQGNRSFQGWLAQEQVQALSISDNTLLFNCNTPHDLLTQKRGV